MSGTDLSQKLTSRFSHTELGVGMALVTVAFWTIWITSTRFAMRGVEPLDPVLLAFIRFGTATLVLAPFWWPLRGIPRNCSPLICTGLLFAGLPYQFMVL